MMHNHKRTSRRRAVVGGPARVESVEPRLLFATFFVTTTADGGAGSFRQAIIDANTAPNPADDVDYILFNIAGTGTQTIALTSPLPTVTGIVTIDGSGDDLVTPTIELNGAGAGAGADGLTLASTDPVLASFVTGLIINRFSGNGIRIIGDSNGVGLNYIGTNAAGTAAGAGNGGSGIRIESSNNFASDNVIAFNAGDGVFIPTGAGNDVGINNIFENGGLGIDLGPDGRTANDAGDADTGANDLQNFPIITGVTAAVAPATGVVVAGTVNSTANTDLDIAIYSSPTSEGEGRTFLDHFQLTTDAAGNATFSRTVTGATTADFFTTTATRLFVLPNGDSFAISTSEFSDVFPTVVPPGGTIGQVYVRGSAWLGADADPANVTFKEFLETKGLGDDVYGYRADTVTTTLPWINVNQLVLRYTGPVDAATVSAASIVLDGQASDYAVTAVAQVDAQSVVLTLNRALGIQPAGSPDITLGDRVRLTVPGAGTAGAAYSLMLNVLQGDADRAANARIATTDVNFVKARLNRNASEVPPAGAAYTAFADLNADGRILTADINTAKARLNDILPAPLVAAAGFSNSRIADEVLA